MSRQFDWSLARRCPLLNPGRRERFALTPDSSVLFASQGAGIYKSSTISRRCVLFFCWRDARFHLTAQVCWPWKNRRPACAETLSISSIFPMIGQQRASRLLRRITATCSSTRLYLMARLLCRGCSTLATEAEKGKGCAALRQDSFMTILKK